jgi:hypothetical protein
MIRSESPKEGGMLQALKISSSQVQVRGRRSLRINVKGDKTNVNVNIPLALIGNFKFVSLA